MPVARASSRRQSSGVRERAARDRGQRMRLIAVVLALGVVTGLALGGKPATLSLADVRWRWAVVGLVLQAAPWPAGAEWLELPLLDASFALLFAFALAN